MDEINHENECNLVCCDEYDAVADSSTIIGHLMVDNSDSLTVHPVEVDLSMRLASWTFSTKNLESGLYDVIIGLTTANMKVDLIESLTFRIAAGDGKSIAPSERIWKEDLAAMCGAAQEPVKLKLCLQLEQAKEYDTLMMIMDIRPSYAASSAADNGRIDMGHLDLCFMELHASENADLDQGIDR
ncbi:hypothetical protein BGZ72_002069 [Mortierella alpina]|nr:hypothetical protein BGZ72_002069 [Mortierella alpina]